MTSPLLGRCSKRHLPEYAEKEHASPRPPRQGDRSLYSRRFRLARHEKAFLPALGVLVPSLSPRRKGSPGVRPAKFREVVPHQLTPHKHPRVPPGALRGCRSVPPRGSPTPGGCSARRTPSAESRPVPMGRESLRERLSGLAEVPHQRRMLVKNSWCGTGMLER